MAITLEATTNGGIQISTDDDSFIVSLAEAKQLIDDLEDIVAEIHDKADEANAG